MNLTQEENDNLLNELVAIATPVRQPGDVDARQYSEKLANGMTERYCSRLLELMVKQGKLTRHEVYDPDKKHRAVVYRKVKIP